MRADRTNLRRVLADVDVAAVSADPDHVAVSREYDAFLDVREQLSVALLVLLLNQRDLLEQECDVVEALGLCVLGKALVHVGPLVVFAFGGVFQVRDRVRHIAVVQQLEPDLRVLLLVVRGLGEELGDLLVAVLLRLRGIVGVLVSGLRLTRKGSHQVCFGLCAL